VNVLGRRCRTDGMQRLECGYNGRMFSRYVSPDPLSIEREFDLVHAPWEFSDNFNVAPTSDIPVIRVIDGQPDPAVLHWGFGDPVLYQVAAESLSGEKGLLEQGQRCILPAMGFYELRDSANDPRRPFYVHVEDQAVFGFAGFWERGSCVVVTVPANTLIKELAGVETRMLAVLAREMRDVWLYGSAASAAAALCSYPSASMIAYPVSTRVCSLENNDETLIEPLETDVD
jgi:putative SOS response-associated peptidase YedK